MRVGPCKWACACVSTKYTSTPYYHESSPSLLTKAPFTRLLLSDSAVYCSGCSFCSRGAECFHSRRSSLPAIEQLKCDCIRSSLNNAIWKVDTKSDRRTCQEWLFGLAISHCAVYCRALFLFLADRPYSCCKSHSLSRLRARMASNLCCTVPHRTGSPVLPNVRLIAIDKPGSATGRLSPEHHEELRAIFQSASGSPARVTLPKSKSRLKLDVESGHPKGPARRPSLVEKLKTRLSKQSMKDSISLNGVEKSKGKSVDLKVIEEAKQNFPASLLNSGRGGGYDSDANSLDIQECSMTSRESPQVVHKRGRKTMTRPALKDTPWGSRKASSLAASQTQGFMVLWLI